MAWPFLGNHALSAAPLAALALAVSPTLAQAADPPAQATAVAKSALATPKYGAWGFDASGIDPSTRAGDDFYRWANGAWADHTEIADDDVTYGVVDKIVEVSRNRVHEIVEDAAAGNLSDPDGQKIGAAYAAYMDVARADTLDARPIGPELALIRAIKTKAQFTALMGKANTAGFTSILPVRIETDWKNPQRYAVFLYTGGLGLPDRDYYLQASFAEQKAKYQAYVQQILTLIGWEKPAESAKAVVDFETALAEATWTRAEQRDGDKLYNPATLAQLQAMTPGVDWTAYLAAMKLPATDRFIVTTNTAFPKFARIYADTPLGTLKAWEAYHLTDGAAPLLSKRFVDASFAFHDRTLRGQVEQRPRWRLAVEFVNGVIGESVGRVYVARYFPPDSKAKMDALVGDLLAALKSRIEALAWMGPETKARALEKLSKLTVKVGYPARWRDYGPLVLRADDLYGDAMRSRAYGWQHLVTRLNLPRDKSEWGLPPQTVNAYYDAGNNEIVFPAAILQTPLFDPDADPAVNYGGIGGVIGHEITHAFDDEGRHVDGDGALRGWWTAEDAARFEVQAQRLGAHYSGFEPLPGAHINGQLTMGENIADLGGLALALDAYHASLRGRAAPMIDGFTGDQRVFLGWAQGWRQKIREATLRQRLVADPHSPAYYRVDGVIRNIDGWYSAFDIKPGDRLYIPPEQRVRIW